MVKYSTLHKISDSAYYSEGVLCGISKGFQFLSSVDESRGRIAVIIDYLVKQCDEEYAGLPASDS